MARSILVSIIVLAILHVHTSAGLPVPHLELTVSPLDGFRFTLSANVTNVGTHLGVGPFIDILSPSTVTLPSTFGKLKQETQLVLSHSFTSSDGCIEHPLLKSIKQEKQQVCGKIGTTLWIYRLPYYSIDSASSLFYDIPASVTQTSVTLHEKITGRAGFIYSAYLSEHEFVDGVTQPFYQFGAVVELNYDLESTTNKRGILDNCQYEWTTWSGCSKSCSGGVRTRSSQCICNVNGEMVPSSSSLCAPSEPSKESGDCNQRSCSPCFFQQYHLSSSDRILPPSSSITLQQTDTNKALITVNSRFNISMISVYVSDTKPTKEPETYTNTMSFDFPSYQQTNTVPLNVDCSVNNYFVVKVILFNGQSSETTFGYGSSGTLEGIPYASVMDCNACVGQYH
eukprot:TRINITY_DN11224_c0_g1_i1.p1 TRINITY_DN11224_c0_g1~~TRINITY_DN11224_c0_g1_i1.p1  ORF type:complete len:397 (+),score=43.84 TRINITY_DN11224_c0_g1_i1:91-1281(+)